MLRVIVVLLWKELAKLQVSLHNGDNASLEGDVMVVLLSGCFVVKT
jgi:hypothetical protein